jgi:hypothetical protein
MGYVVVKYLSKSIGNEYPSLEVYYELLRDYYMRRLPKLLKKDDLNRVGVGEGRFWCEGGRRTSAL